MTEQPNSGLAKFGVGCVTTLAVLFGLIFLAGLLNPKKKRVDVQLTGRVEQHFFAGPTFELAVWHRHPGNLRNGKLSVWVMGKAIAKEDEHKVHSFETWPPNETNAVNFSFPLHDYDPNQPLRVTCYVTPANARDTPIQFVWQNNRWHQ